MKSTFEFFGGDNPQRLFGALTHDTVGHGYLFTGPAGCGKKTFARKLARSLLCQSVTDSLLGYCNDCASCRMLDSKNHPDYTELIGEIRIGKTNERSGEEISARGIVKQLALHPYHGSYRVATLGDISFATEESANALLKFIEEPPNNVLLLLTTSAAGRLLATIKSRLIEVPFAHLDDADVTAILTAEGVDPGRAARAAASAQGNTTQARALLNDAATNVRTIAFGWMLAAMEGRSPDLQLDERGATPAERREWLGQFLESARTIARDYAVRTVAGDDAPIMAKELAGEMRKLPRRSPKDATRVLESVSETIQISRTNVSPALVATFLRVAIAPASRCNTIHS
jgi:DNA polymerase-3 subunit delta'